MSKKSPAMPVRIAPANVLPAAPSRHIPIKKIVSITVLIALTFIAGFLAIHHDRQRRSNDTSSFIGAARFALVEHRMLATGHIYLNTPTSS